jgi:hypothetical protein
MNRPFARQIALLALASVLGSSGCSKEPEAKKDKAHPAKVMGAAAGNTAACEQEKQQLVNKLKASQNQVAKLKKQLRSRRAKRK